MGRSSSRESGIVSLLKDKRLSRCIVAHVPRRSHEGHSKHKASCPNQTQTNKPMTSPAIMAIGQQFPADRFGLLIQRLPVLQLAWDCVLLKLLLKLL